MSSGDRPDDLARKEVSKLYLPDSETIEFPDDTLIVNPLDDKFPQDQTVVIDMTYEFSGGLMAFVRFKGGAKYLENSNQSRIVYQIAVLQQDRLAPTRAKANFMTDPIYMDSNDLELALDAIQETIQKDLIYQVRDMIAASLRAAKIDKAQGKEVDMPWFVVQKDENFLTKMKKFARGFGKGKK